MKPRHKKLAVVVLALSVLGIAAALVLNAFRSNLVFFYTPTQIAAGEAPTGGTFRIGGLVEQGSVKKDGLNVHFVVTDLNKQVAIAYEGILPDLFREGQGIVAQGRLAGPDRFIASQVLAKHDEKYMPPEVAAALKPAKGAKPAANAKPTVAVPPPGAAPGSATMHRPSATTTLQKD